MELAEEIARRAHRHQKGKYADAGCPYIDHVERVVAGVEGAEAKTAAWLHDVVEDTEVDILSLHALGFSHAVTSAVSWLTRNKGIPYQRYIEHLAEAGDPIEKAVKISDLRDHLRDGCPPHLRTKYERALAAMVAHDPNLVLSGAEGQDHA